MSYIYEVFEHLKQLWMGIWQHIHTVTTTDVSPDLGELAEILDDVSVEMIPIRTSKTSGYPTQDLPRLKSYICRAHGQMLADRPRLKL